MMGPLPVCCWDGRGPVFRRGGGRGEGLRTASTALWRAVLLGNRAICGGLGGFGRIRAGRNGRPDGHTARSAPSFRLLTPDRGERQARGGMLQLGLAADQASPGSFFVES